MRRISQGASARRVFASRTVPVLVACGLISGVLISISAGGGGRAKTASPAAHAQSQQEARPMTKAAPAKPVGVLVAFARVASLPVYSAPGKRHPEQSLANPNNLGAPLVLLVNNLHRGWIQAYLPERPNESLGWTLLADVKMVRDPERIVVSLRSRRLELLNAGKVEFRAPVAVGSPASPTPSGHFYVTERLKVADPAGSAYGPYVLGLSGFSDTYTSFDGGPGQIAIHGTDQPWDVGKYASHGCVRLNNTEITALMAQVEVGTPVDITE